MTMALSAIQYRPSAGSCGASPSSSKIAIRALLRRGATLPLRRRISEAASAACGTRSAHAKAERPQSHHNDRARDQAPAAGNGKTDSKREEIDPIRRHEPQPASRADLSHEMPRRATISLIKG